MVCSGCYNKISLLGGFDNTNLFLTVLGSEKSMIKVHGDISGDAFFLAYRQPPAHCILAWKRHGKRALVSLSLLIGHHTIRVSPYLQIQSHWGLRLQHINLEGDTIQFIAGLGPTGLVSL